MKAKSGPVMSSPGSSDCCLKRLVMKVLSGDSGRAVMWLGCDISCIVGVPHVVSSYKVPRFARFLEFLAV